MKRSTKLMIALTISVILMTGGFMLFIRINGIQCGTYDNVTLSGEVKSMTLPMFKDLEVTMTMANTGHMVWITGMPFNIVADSSAVEPRLIYPENLSDSIEFDMSECKLDLKILTGGTYYEYDKGTSGNVTIVVPTTMEFTGASLGTNYSIDIVIKGLNDNFKIDGLSDNTQNLIVDGCDFDSLSVKNFRNYDIRGSRTKLLNIYSESSIDVAIGSGCEIERLVLEGGSADGIDFDIEGRYNGLEVKPSPGHVINVSNVIKYKG